MHRGWRSVVDGATHGRTGPLTLKMTSMEKKCVQRPNVVLTKVGDIRERKYVAAFAGSVGIVLNRVPKVEASCGVDRKHMWI